MKKIRLVLLLLAALALAGCDTNDSPANKESTIGNLLPPADWEQYVTVENGESGAEGEAGTESECNVNDNAAVHENTNTYLVRHSEWYPYEWVEDVPSYGTAGDHDFMNSGGQYVHMYWFYALSDILYNYGQRTDQNLLSDGWVVDGITPIGSGYYNARLHQKSYGAIADVLIDDNENEYKVLYIICDAAEWAFGREWGYMSQYDWKPYIWEETSAEVDNPFFEIYESSLDTVIAAAVTAYEKETEYGGEWIVKEIYGYYELKNYLVTSKDRVVWFCLDSYSGEYATETFYIESQ